MGLDIRTYTNIRRVPPEEEKAVLEHPDGPHEGAYEKGYAFPDINPHFPGREEGVEEVPYAFDEDIHFRAGSYSGHSVFRQHICNVLGLGVFRAWIQSKGTDTHGPFEEFLNFSDCEGVIGPVVSKKLAADFVEHEKVAREYAMELNVKDLIHQGWEEEKAQEQAAKINLDTDQGWNAGTSFWETYQNWKNAFLKAGNGGFVRFS